ncbi:MAG: dihydroorotase [Elusimicrobium sp.]|jgi:dihydroorotase|nr:dihydroorotase [Elusimicrobium sp.]
MFLIKNARMADAVTDILIEDGIIKKIGANIDAKNARLINAYGLTAVPGFIDMHVHLREPGYEVKETLSSGSASAAKGGFTTVCMMPNTNPPMDNAANVNRAQEIIKRGAAVNVEIIGAITKGRAGKEITDFAELKNCGVIALSDDGSEVEDNSLMQAAAQSAAKNNMLLISHAEDTKLAAGGVMNKSVTAVKLGLKGISNESEFVMVERDIKIAEQFKARLHIAHVSTKESCEIIAAAKKRGVLVTAEVTPHHLTLTDRECESFSGNAKMNPPLRSAADVEAVRKALASGVIDVVATDHAPHAVHEKEVEFELAAFGIIGLETAFALCYETMVLSGLMSFEKLIEAMTAKPAKILGLKKGVLSEGAAADITLLDLNKEWEYSREEILSASCNTPYIGRRLRGGVEYTFAGGKLKYGNIK